MIREGVDMARTITIEDLYQIKFVSKPRISTDGQRVAFVVTTIDGDKHKYHSSVWVAPAAGGEARRFTTGPANADSPVWSPDGRWLAFVSEREGEASGKDQKEQKKQEKSKGQIWVMPTDGGEARQLTFMEHGAGAPVWSPDSKSMLFSAQVGSTDEEGEDGKPLPKARVIDRLWYRIDGVGFIYERRAHLFLVEATGGKPQQLTDGDWDDSDAAWSPDGTQIAFCSNRRDDRWKRPGDDLYTLALQDGNAGDLRCLTDGELSCNGPSWSPDGKALAFVGAPKLHGAGHTYLYTIAASAENAAPTNLSQAFDGSCMDWTNSDIGDEHLAPSPVWSADGKTLYVLASHHGAGRIFAIPVTGASARPRTLTPGDVHVRDFTTDAACDKISLLLGTSTSPQEIFVCSTASSGEMSRITSTNDALFSQLTLSPVEYMPFKGVDDWDIDGWIIKPPDFDPAKKYPLVVEIHGGP